MLSCKDVAEYLLFVSGCGNGSGEVDLVSNLKLQKLCYYAQGFHLAMYNEPLFSEHIEAWTHGPVIPDLYHEYKVWNSGALPIPENIDLSKFDYQTRELLDEIHNVFGQFSAWKLANMTHEEWPWKEAAPNREVISHNSLREYFKTQLING